MGTNAWARGGLGRGAASSRPVIVIAEDDPIVRELLEELVEMDLGADVLTAGSGAELRRLLDQTTPSLIVLDIVMPDDDGLEIARMVRSDARLGGTPIVAVTAQNNTGAILEAGCRAVVEKPFQVDELVRVIRRALAPAAAPP